MIKVFFISIDPERDTPEVMKDYLNSFENNNKTLDNELKSIELKEIDYKYLVSIQRYPVYYKFYAKKLNYYY